jgi:hypothetical protein
MAHARLARHRCMCCWPGNVPTLHVRACVCVCVGRTDRQTSIIHNLSTLCERELLRARAGPKDHQRCWARSACQRTAVRRHRTTTRLGRLSSLAGGLVAGGQGAPLTSLSPVVFSTRQLMPHEAAGTIDRLPQRGQVRELPCMLLTEGTQGEARLTNEAYVPIERNAADLHLETARAPA